MKHNLIVTWHSSDIRYGIIDVARNTLHLIIISVCPHPGQV